MSSQTEAAPRRPTWWFWTESMNEQFAEAVEEGMTAQLNLAEAWMDAIEDATGQEELDEGMEGVLRAYEVWMLAARDTFELVNDTLEGEDVPVDQFRDTWLNAANQAFKEVLGTATFSMMTGQSVDDLLDLRRQMDEATASTLRDLGLPTHSDIEEVGERLVELERRNHAIEGKLDEVIDAIESGG